MSVSRLPIIIKPTSWKGFNTKEAGEDTKTLSVLCLVTPVEQRLMILNKALAHPVKQYCLLSTWMTYYMCMIVSEQYTNLTACSIPIHQNLRNRISHKDNYRYTAGTFPIGTIAAIEMENDAQSSFFQNEFAKICWNVYFLHKILQT